MLSQLKHVFKFRAVTQRLLNTSTILKVNYPAPAKSPSDPTVKNIHKADSNGMLYVTWNNNTVNRYPFVYLRDNCRVQNVFTNLLSKGRLIRWAD